MKKGFCAAARELHFRLEGEPWFQGIGLGATQDGKPCFYVYHRPSRKLPKPLREIAVDGYEGFPVVVSSLGSIRPVRA